MPSFTYKAKDQSGNIVNGAVDAGDSHLAAAKIREMGYWPIEVLPERVARAASKSGFGNPIWTGVSLRSLAVFFRQFATMVDAGMAIGESLDHLGKHRGMGKLSVIACRAADRVRNGGTLSETLGDYPNIFTPMQLGLIRAGERSGGLDRMIERIAVYLERELALRHKFARVTFYPKLLFIAIICIPHAPAMVLGGTPAVINFLHDVLLTYLLIGLGLYIAIRSLLMIPPVRLAWDVFKLHVPILGGVTRKLAMARFSTALSVMYSSGLPMSQAVEYSAGSLGNEVLRRAVLTSIPHIQAGGNFTDSLRKIGQIPDLVISMLSTGEKTGSYDTVLDKVNEYYTTEAETTLEKTGFLLFVLLILLAGAMVLPTVLGGFTKYLKGIGL